MAEQKDDLTGYRLRERYPGARKRDLPRLVGFDGMDLDGPCHHFPGLARDVERLAPRLLPRANKRRGFASTRKHEEGFGLAARRRRKRSDPPGWQHRQHASRT